MLMKPSMTARMIALFLLVCLVIAAAPGAAGALDDPQEGNRLSQTQALYNQLSDQAASVMKESIAVPQPPSIAVSCAKGEKAQQDSDLLSAFQTAFGSPEGDLCAQMLAIQKELQLLGCSPGYQREAALMDRLGQKALTLIKEYGQDIEKVPAIGMVSLQTAKDIQLLGLDQVGRSAALMDAVSAMYERAIEELFRRLEEEHDYAAARTILDAARTSLLLSENSDVDTEELLDRLRQAMRFELTLTYNYEQTGNHRWLVQAVFDVQAAFDAGDDDVISGSGTGSMLSFVWDDTPEFTVAAPDFPVQAELRDFDPCGAGVLLALTPFHPQSETAIIDGEAIPWPLLKLSWETAFSENLQADGLYGFTLTLRNADSTAVSDTLVYSVPDNEVSLEVLLVHKPRGQGPA